MRGRGDRQTRDQTVGAILALLAASALGLAIAVSRFAYDGGTDGITVATSRACVMVISLPLFCLLSGRRLRLPWRDWWHCAGLGLLMVPMFYGNVGAVEFIPVGLTALLFFTYPPMIAALNMAVVRQPVGTAKLVAIAGAFAGLALMLGVSFETVDGRGVALALGAAAATAWNAVWLARRLAGRDPVVLTMHMGLIAAAGLLLLAYSGDGLVWPTAAVGWAGLFGVVALQASAVPIYFVALARIGALNSGMLSNVQPVVSIAAAFLFFGEILTAVQLFGGLMVLGGIWLMQWSDRRRG
ncbi:MAG: DMT family transporter [Alphaproteobacteria bacterium]|jgi:DME family drug/metabolite transporter|nr:DMT family transporter [Alphaproteobacteria bacterium]MDP6565108.1 DMT family transporter [Alphaproteobacteria bacterium]MDP6815960.1 DMT family transporter [Alphaproteobacteria bacterium]